MTCGDFAQKIAQLQAITPFSVTSWWRSRQRNQDKGGHVDSLHLIGLAVDVILDDWSELNTLTHYIKRIGLSYKPYSGNTHLHIQIPYQKDTN